jgi:8-oxo-dGTP diphosphatase
MSDYQPHLAPYTGRLRVRVCGICLHEEKVLMVRHKPILRSNAFWAPPGGGLAYGEQVKDCLVREVLEETGLQVRAGEFLGVNEFIGAPLHAIELFFSAHLAGGELLIGSDPEVEPEQQLIEQVRFLSLSELQQLNPVDLHPFLRDLSRLEDLHRPRSRFFSMNG